MLTILNIGKILTSMRHQVWWRVKFQAPRSDGKGQRGCSEQETKWTSSQIISTLLKVTKQRIWSKCVDWIINKLWLLAPQSGANKRGDHRDFHPSHSTHLLLWSRKILKRPISSRLITLIKCLRGDTALGLLLQDVLCWRKKVGM